jgi:hypothetical protein
LWRLRDDLRVLRICYAAYLAYYAHALVTLSNILYSPSLAFILIRRYTLGTSIMEVPWYYFILKKKKIAMWGNEVWRTLEKGERREKSSLPNR